MTCVARGAVELPGVRVGVTIGAGVPRATPIRNRDAGGALLRLVAGRALDVGMLAVQPETGVAIVYETQGSTGPPRLVVAALTGAFTRREIPGVRVGMTCATGVVIETDVLHARRLRRDACRLQVARRTGQFRMGPTQREERLLVVERAAIKDDQFVLVIDMAIVACTA